jgi:hypothetical protein
MSDWISGASASLPQGLSTRMHWLGKKKKDPEARWTTRTQGPRSGVGSQVGRPCASATETMKR